MSNDISSVPITTLLLAVDMVPFYMKALGEKISGDLWTGGRELATAAKPWASTIWMTYQDDFESYARERTLQPGVIGELAKKYNLERCRPEPGEEIIVKPQQNGFHGGGLLNFLEENYPDVDTLMFIGGYTDVCLARTVYSALRLRYDCIAIPGLMFSSRQSPNNAHIPHETILRDKVLAQLNAQNLKPSYIKQAMEALTFHTPESALQWLKEKPALPQGQAPVPFNPQPVA